MTTITINVDSIGIRDAIEESLEPIRKDAIRYRALMLYAPTIEIDGEELTRILDDLIESEHTK